jgi:hypothetical protein
MRKKMTLWWASFITLRYTSFQKIPRNATQQPIDLFVQFVSSAQGINVMEAHLILYYVTILFFVYILFKLQRLFRARKRLSRNLRSQLR